MGSLFQFHKIWLFIKQPIDYVFQITFMLVALQIFMQSCVSPANNEQQVVKKLGQDISFNELMPPVPNQAKFKDDDYHIWGSSMLKGEDGQYHLYFSRWPRESGHSAWVVQSEIAHATADKPAGSYTFKDVALPERGREYWDGKTTHNPTIHRFDEKYYLYYMGTTGDGKLYENDLNWIHRNNQRIGVAIADEPEGPWKRFQKPLIDVSKDDSAHDALMVSNPSITKMADGRFLMVYKAVAKKRKMPFGGPVVHLTAISNSPTGPFEKHMKPIFTAEDVDFPAEDPYVWQQGNGYFAIVKDMGGAFTNYGKSLVLFKSSNGSDWELTQKPLVTEFKVNWADGTTDRFERLERPQIFFRNGQPTVLFLAAYDGTNSFNIHVPLR